MQAISIGDKVQRRSKYYKGLTGTVLDIKDKSENYLGVRAKVEWQSTGTRTGKTVKTWIKLTSIKLTSIKHGGYRKGSGAKKKPEHLKKEPTKVMRVPMSLVSHVVGLIKKP